jgi:hypothetical protein
MGMKVHSEGSLIPNGLPVTFDGVWSPPVGGFIVPETLRERGGLLQTSDARLDSYGRLQLGALVPVTESDFGCCGQLFGGELACPRPSSTPPESLCMIANRAEPGQFKREKVCHGKAQAIHLRAITEWSQAES